MYVYKIIRAIMLICWTRSFIGLNYELKSKIKTKNELLSWD